MIIHITSSNDCISEWLQLLENEFHYKKKLKNYTFFYLKLLNDNYFTNYNSLKTFTICFKWQNDNALLHGISQSEFAKFK